MELDRSYHERVLRFLPDAFRARAVIAGGWAVSPTRANDIDLWVLAQNEQDFFRTRALMLVHLSHLASQGCELAFTDDEENYGTHHHLLATVSKGFAGKDVQLLVSDLKTPQALVESFDISTHAVAIGFPVPGPAQVWTAPEYTTTQDTPRVMRFSTPDQTLRRLQKISTRYGLVPNPADVNLLLARLPRDFEVAA